MQALFEKGKGKLDGFNLQLSREIKIGLVNPNQEKGSEGFPSIAIVVVVGVVQIWFATRDSFDTVLVSTMEIFAVTNFSESE